MPDKFDKEEKEEEGDNVLLLSVAHCRSRREEKRERGQEREKANHHQHIPFFYL
jgi:hypothetical protein